MFRYLWFSIPFNAYCLCTLRVKIFLVHRKNYEETMMVRLNMTRDQKVRKRGLVGMTSQLSNITRFGDITGLIGGEGSVRLCKCSCVDSLCLFFCCIFFSFRFVIHLCLLQCRRWKNQDPKRRNWWKRKQRERVCWIYFFLSVTTIGNTSWLLWVWKSEII